MATLTEKKGKLTSYPFLTAISLFLMFGLGTVLKPWSTVTEMGIHILGVYVGVLLMLIMTKETIWPPVLGMAALVLHGYNSASGVLQAWMGNTTVVMVFFILAICGALRESGAPMVLANVLMTRKITRGRPIVFLLMLFFASTLLSMLTSGTTTILIMYEIAAGLMEACGYDMDSDEHRFILLGIYISNIGAYMLPFKGIHLSTLAVATGIMESCGVQFNSVLYLVACCLTVVTFVIVYTLMGKYVFKLNLDPLKNLDTSKLDVKGSGTKFNSRQLTLLMGFVVGIVLMLINMFVPKGSAYGTFMSTLGSAWPWVIIFCLLCIPHLKDGKPFINGAALLRDNAMWSMVVMIGCISMCGQAISNDELGIKAWLLELLTPVLGDMSFFVMVAAAVIFCTVLTQFFNGSPIAYVLNTLCIPFACILEQNGKGSATAICSAITFCCFFAFVTPAASSTAPLITGHANMNSKFLWTKGWIYTAVWIVIAIVMFYFCGIVL